MPDKKHFRVFATCDIGSEALDRLRQRGYDVEVYPHPEAPPKLSTCVICRSPRL